MSDSYNKYQEELNEYNFLCNKFKVKHKKGFNQKNLKKIRKLEAISYKHGSILRKYLNNKDLEIEVFPKFNQKWENLKEVGLDFIYDYNSTFEYRVKGER